MRNRKFELPLPVDENNKPSVTLLCAWVSFFCSELLTFQAMKEVPSELGKVSVLGIGFFTMVFFALMMRMKRIDKFNFDLKNGKIDVDSDETPEQPTPAAPEVKDESVTNNP